MSFTVLHIFCFVVWSSIIMEHVSLYEDDPYICFVKSFWKYTCINLYHTSCLINGYLKLVYLLIIHFILYSLLPKNCNNASYLLPIRIIIINMLTSFMIYTSRQNYMQWMHLYEWLHIIWIVIKRSILTIIILLPKVLYYFKVFYRWFRRGGRHACLQERQEV